MAQDLTTAVEGVNKGELFTSFDVDAFEVPHGRDELWRFTPLKRLRGLHDGSAVATGTARIEVSDCDGVAVETVSRGLTEDEAMAMVVRGFVEPIAKELPMEYALELNRLTELQMEGAVG